ncbi:MAG: DoxX family membrane protein [Bacteroidota bacterium]
MKSKILLVLNVLFGLIFINSGLNKFFNYMPMPEEMPAKMAENFEAFMTISWLMPLIAVVEIIAGFLCLTKKYRALGSVMLFPIMIGIMLTHIIVAPDGLIIAIVLFAILLWNLFENRAKIEPLWK